jgi:formylglycine-generating enzyme required for sulfatase activity
LTNRYSPYKIDFMRPLSRNLVTILFSALLWVPLVFLYGQDGRSGLASIGKQWAVFIAIDRYDEWGTLGNPVRDAKDIRDILVGMYRIQEVYELYNGQATADNVRNLLADLRKRTGPTDSVFVFYAGGGQIDKFTGAGSWMLTASQPKGASLLANDEVQSMLSVLPAKHVLLISDACFTGSGLDISRNTPEFTVGYYNEAYNKVSRQVMTSGAVKTGPSSAKFLDQLKRSLRNAQGRYIDAEALFGAMQDVEPDRSQSAAKPLLLILKNQRQEPVNLLSLGTAHQDGGSFVFFKDFSTAMPEVPPLSAVREVGHIAVTSEISGMVMLQGIETGTRIRANGTALLWNVPAGDAEVAVKSDEGQIFKAYLATAVKPEETAAAAIEHPFIDRFARIPEGTFVMGSPQGEAGRSDDETQRRIKISSFYMQKQEVSRAEFQQFLSETGYEPPLGSAHIWNGTSWEIRADADWRNPHFPQDDRHPVTLVSWYDAVEYCNWRSLREGLQPAYIIEENVSWDPQADGYRLPTEAEWEYAVRGGRETPFWVGERIGATEANFAPYPRDQGIYRQATVPADEFPPNPWGLYNMHGNVWEWCWDWYAPYKAEDQADPIGESLGEYRVRRGGSWSAESRYARSAYRSYMTPTHRYNDTGFRLVRSIPEK